ncbi:staygreen family protein [Chloroflexota bacterium]
MVRITQPYLLQKPWSLQFDVYCHVSGGFVVGGAKWRYDIFRSELPLVLEAIRYGDRTVFQQHPDLDQIPVHIHFQSSNLRFNNVEQWGIMADYK